MMILFAYFAGPEGICFPFLSAKAKVTRPKGGDSSTPTFLMINFDSLVFEAVFLGNFPSSTATTTAYRKSWGGRVSLGRSMAPPSQESPKLLMAD